MDHIESLCLRYVAQNSDDSENPVLMTELQDMLDTSWIILRQQIMKMQEFGIFKKIGKNKALHLTTKGWKLFNEQKEMKQPMNKVTRPTFKESSIKKEVERPIDKVNMNRLNMEIDGVIKPVSSWKVGDYNAGKVMKFVGGEISKPQETYYSRWKDYIENWDTHPRK